MRQGLYIISVVMMACASASPGKHTVVLTHGYDFAHPDQSMTLPDTLREISGLTELDHRTVACVQDENGILFIYDIMLNSIRQQYTFNIDGDYEGITRVGSDMFILRSDGVLFEILDFASKSFSVVLYQTEIPADNNEGLCYDQTNHRLLIGCKSKAGKGKEFKDLRVIYAFDLAEKKLSDQPVFSFDVAQLKEMAILKELDVPSRPKKKGEIEEPMIKFRLSAVAVHPVSHHLYVLSAADHMLFVFDHEGAPLSIIPLDPLVHNKAEGITFFDNGDMLITNEAQDARPTLHRFKYHPDGN